MYPMCLQAEMKVQGTFSLRHLSPLQQEVAPQVLPPRSSELRAELNSALHSDFLLLSQSYHLEM